VGHVLRGMRKVYDHHLYVPEKRAAMEAGHAAGVYRGMRAEEPRQTNVDLLPSSCRTHVNG
jgi:hypothetical protein